MEITWNGTVTSGILQGSILGLILFVKFINDLLEYASYQKCYVSPMTPNCLVTLGLKITLKLYTTWLEQPLWLECWIDVTIPPRQT